MLADIFKFIAAVLFWNRVVRYLERRVERKGPYGAPFVTLVAAVIGAVAGVGLLLVERRLMTGGGVPIWLPIPAVARLALVALIAYGLRLNGTARRGGRWWFAIVLAEIVNICSMIVDGMAVFSGALGQAITVLGKIDGGGGKIPHEHLGVLLTVAVVGLLADLIIAFTLRVRQLILE